MPLSSKVHQSLAKLTGVFLIIILSVVILQFSRSVTSLPSATHEDIPLPFGGSMDLRGKLTDIGISGNRRIVDVTLEPGDAPQTLEPDVTYFLVLPQDLPGTLALSDVISDSARAYGYKYTSGDGAIEKERQKLLASNEPVFYSQLFPGDFFATDDQRKPPQSPDEAGLDIAHFEEQKTVTFRPTAEVLVGPGDRILLMSNSPQVALALPEAPDSGSPSSGSANADSEECQIQAVFGMIKQCCRSKYSVYYTCRQFTDTFVTLCAQAGMSCSTVDIFCADSPNGHRIAEVTIDGIQCLVEPQGHIISCDLDTPESLQNAICSAMSLPSGCSCSASSTSAAVDTSDFTMCAMSYAKNNPQDVNGCYKCCDTSVEYHQGRGDPLASTWLQDCKNSCDVIVDGVSCDECPSGYLGTCDAKQCIQQYNTGLCKKGSTTECIALSRTCEHSGLTCDRPDLPPNPSSACPGNCVAGYIPDTCDVRDCKQLYNTGLCQSGTSQCFLEFRTCDNAAVACACDPSECGAAPLTSAWICHSEGWEPADGPSFCPGSCVISTQNIPSMICPGSDNANLGLKYDDPAKPIRCTCPSSSSSADGCSQDICEGKSIKWLCTGEEWVKKSQCPKSEGCVETAFNHGPPSESCTINNLLQVVSSGSCTCPSSSSVSTSEACCEDGCCVTCQQGGACPAGCSGYMCVESAAGQFGCVKNLPHCISSSSPSCSCSPSDPTVQFCMQAYSCSCVSGKLAGCDSDLRVYPNDTDPTAASCVGLQVCP